MALKQGNSNFRKNNWLKGMVALALIMLCATGYELFQTWNLERLMTFYEVRKNFPDPVAQNFIAQVIQGRTDEVLSSAKEVPGGVNAAGTNGLTPLMVAVLRLNLPMVKALLAAGANPNGDVKQVPLHMAVRAYNLTIAKTLLEAGTDPNGLPGSEPPLIEAALIDYREAVDLLLKAGARVDAPSRLGETAAITAAAAGHIDMVNYLLDHGASIWATSKVGFTVPRFGAKSCENPTNQVQDCARLIARIKAAHFPWPPPSSIDVEKLMDEGKWPPKEAQGQ